MIIFSNLLKGNEDKTLKINSIDAEVIESLDQEILSLTGNVVIKTDIVQLWSDRAIYDRENQTIQLEGNIKALSKNLSIEAQNMEADFIGKDALKEIVSSGVSRKLVGLEISGVPLMSANNEFWPVIISSRKVGHISSAIFSPRLEKNIALPSDTNFEILKL